MKFYKRLEQLWGRSRRYTTRYLLVAAGGFLTHGMLAVMFALAGRRGFTAMNVASLLFYAVWLWQFSRRPVNAPMLAALYLNVLLHACAYNLVLGREPAFYLYPLVIIPSTFFLSTRELKTPMSMAGSWVLPIFSVLLILATLSGTPRAPLESPSQNDQFFRWNVLMCALMLSAFTSEFLTEAMDTQKTLSFHAENDQLTGLRNRYGFIREVEQLHGTQYCVVMCDIDDFKQVNDLYGHAVGDLLLSRVAQAMLDSIHREDAVCRWGGEEFLMALRCDAQTARATVGRVRRKLDDVAVEQNGSAVSVTMTFGIADCLEAERFDELVRIADTNLLRGKRSGKNCVVSSADRREPGSPETQLDTAFLESPIFTAFSATSDTTYIYMCNLETNVSRWSRRAVEYFGLPGEYMFDAGGIWMGFIHPDDREAYARDLEAVLAGKKHFHDVNYRARNRDGEYVRLCCKGVVTEGDATHPALFAGTITNLGVDLSAGKREKPSDGMNRWG